MTANPFQPLGSTTQLMPLAAVFSARLLLTETSSAPSHPLFSVASLPTLTVRAATVTRILTNVEGYHHYGIND
jgi:hypothetical protein